MIHATPQFRQQVAHRFAAIGSSFEILPPQQMYTPMEFLALTILDDVETEPIEVMAALSDLIDPTCKPVVDDVHGMDDELVCSECGCFLAIVVDGKPSEPLYRYCPSCGARIVEEE